MCSAARDTSAAFSESLAQEATWQFGSSWAATLTAFGAILGTVLGASDVVSSALPGVRLAEFVALNILFGRRWRFSGPHCFPGPADQTRRWIDRRISSSVAAISYRGNRPAADGDGPLCDSRSRIEGCWNDRDRPGHCTSACSGRALWTPVDHVAATSRRDCGLGRRRGTDLHSAAVVQPRHLSAAMARCRTLGRSTGARPEHGRPCCR